jgi:serine/threonine-protein kinase
MIGVGTILHDTYRIEGELGRGAMGVVFRASHRRVPREFAIKVLTPSIRDSDTAFSRFRREAEISSRLGHPNIIEVFDFNRTDDGQAYFVMELLDGHDLAAEIRGTAPMPPGRVVALLEPVASALAAAHAAGVIHRDLKPSNIFIGKKSSIEIVKVLDFGVSKILGAIDLQTQSEAIVGTPAYMSPEQAHGQAKHADARADQFSLAAIAYEMLTGRRAFGSRGDSPFMTIYRVVSQDPEPAGEIPEIVGSVLSRALSKDAAGRYADVGEFFDAFRRAALGDGAGPPIAGARRRTRSPRRLRTIVVISAAVAAVGLAALAGIRSLTHPPRPASAPVVLPSQPQPPAPPPAAPAPIEPGRVSVTIAPASARVVLVAPDGTRTVLPGPWSPADGRVITWSLGRRPDHARVEADGYEPADLPLPADGATTSQTIRLHRHAGGHGHGDLSYPWRNP